MDIQNATAFIQTVGFPIFVAVVLLWRLDRAYRENSVALSALTLSIELLRAELKDQRRIQKERPL